MPNLYNIVDFTMTQSLEMLQQMYGRLLRKSPTGKQKCYYKVATKNTADYYVDLMTAMLCLATNDNPTYYYSMYNGKNMGGIRIPKVLLNNKKRTKGTSTSSKGKSSKPYVSFVELGIPNDLNIFRQSILHSSDGSFDSIAWTTLDDVRAAFFNINPNRKPYSIQEIYEEAKKYKVKKDFMTIGVSTYRAAKKRGILEDVTKHMSGFRINTISNEELIKIAKKYNLKNDFIKNDKRWASLCMRRGIWEEATKHMTKNFLNSKKIVAISLDTNKKTIFNSIKEAAEKFKCLHQNIAAVVYGQRSSYKGYSFERLNK
jgi:hypothetical protein